MRIVLYTEGFFEYIVELANHLSRRGNEVVLMTSDTVDRGLLSLLDPAVTVSLFKPVHFISIRQNMRWLLDIRKRLKTIRPDVVHVQAYGHPWFLPLFLSLPTYRLMNTVHDPLPHTGDEPSIAGVRRFRWTAGLFNWLCRGVFVHGEILRDQFCARYRYSRARTHVIPMGTFSCYALLSDGKDFSEHSDYLLFFGRIWRYKGLDVFLDAAVRVLEKFPQTKFVIAGRGDDMAPHMQRVAGHSEQFFFYNERIEISKVGSLFQKCAFAVLPYRDATQSAVITTAFGLGKTAVVTRVGALPEIVVDGENGLLVEPNDPEALAVAMCRLISDPAERARLAANAVRTAETALSWEVVAKKTLEAYST